MHIRNVRPEDAGEICRIYNYYIETTCISFETEPVSEEEMKDRIQSFIEGECLYYVVEKEGKMIGFAYMHPWKERRAYSYTKEVTIYLDHEQKGKGVGTVLYRYLLERVDTSRIHSLIAAICIPNDASVRLHEKFGFRQVSHYKEVGYKFGEWKDVGHWQLILGKDVSLNK
ncbi:MAG: N-acetyltransferase family protein [Tannerellaceae bacterium]|nr:N-acetyltransferase family protein [Tannerellaceae bacterium]